VDIEAEKRNRFRFLHRLWELSEGNENKWANLWDIGRELGLDSGQTERVYQYLKGEGLLAIHAMGGTIGITHAGIRQIESALSHPEEPTYYFPPVSLISIGTMTNSTIQQSSPGAVQTFSLGQADIAAIEQVVKEMKNQLDALQLAEDDRRQAEADLATITAQLAAPVPKQGVVCECLASLRRILEHVAASAVAAPIVAKIAQIIG